MAHGISQARASLTFQGPGDISMSLITLFAGGEGAGASAPSACPHIQHPPPCPCKRGN